MSRDDILPLLAEPISGCHHGIANCSYVASESWLVCSTFANVKILFCNMRAPMDFSFYTTNNMHYTLPVQVLGMAAVFSHEYYLLQ